MSAQPAGLTNASGTLFFSAVDSSGGAELWQSDGTAAGTLRVQDIAPGAQHSSPSYMAATGPYLFFSADDRSHGRELWALPLFPPRVYLPIVRR